MSTQGATLSRPRRLRIPVSAAACSLLVVARALPTVSWLLPPLLINWPELPHTAPTTQSYDLHLLSKLRLRDNNKKHGYGLSKTVGDKQLRIFGQSTNCDEGDGGAQDALGDGDGDGLLCCRPLHRHCLCQCQPTSPVTMCYKASFIIISVVITIDFLFLM